jgi:hypothetical protein
MTAERPAFADLLRIVFDLCRWRRGPQDLPHSPNLLASLIGAGVAVDVIIAGALQDTDDVLARSLLSTGLILGLCWIALAMRRLTHRFLQTATALLACSIVFSVLQLPIALLAGPPPATGAELDGAQVFFGWAMIALLIWKLSVDAHIVRQALDAGYALAFALATSWLIAYWALDRILFGVPA